MNQDRCGEWKLTITEVKIYSFYKENCVWGKKQQEKQRLAVVAEDCNAGRDWETGRGNFQLSRKPIPMKGVGGIAAENVYTPRSIHIPHPGAR